MKIYFSILKFEVKYLVLFTFFCCLVNNTYSQQWQTPEAVFRNDSVKIGEYVKLALIYKHKPKIEFLFPDSTYNFYPFEFVKKDFYPTQTDSAGSTDSIVYTLATYELEPILKLSLPVYVFESGDSLPIYSDDAEIYLSEVVTPSSGIDSLQVNTQYRTLSTKLNYPYFLIGIGVLVFISLIVFIFFRKKIVNRYKLFLISRDYKTFIQNFEKQKASYYNLKSTNELENMLSIWKKYLQKLEKQPYTTLTTKEISKIFEENRLTSSLQNFDRAIYGGYINEDLTNSISVLAENASNRFNLKQRELQNA